MRLASPPRRPPAARSINRHRRSSGRTAQAPRGTGAPRAHDAQRDRGANVQDAEINMQRSLPPSPLYLYIYIQRIIDSCVVCRHLCATHDNPGHLLAPQPFPPPFTLPTSPRALLPALSRRRGRQGMRMRGYASAEYFSKPSPCTAAAAGEPDKLKTI